MHKKIKLAKRNCFDDDEFIMSEIPFDSDTLVTAQKSSQTVYHINLDEEIGEPSKYRRVFDVLKNAYENDLIFLRINTLGGLLSTTIQLIQYLDMCKATIIGELYQAYSAGSAIALRCHEIIMSPHSSMMIHNMSTGAIGKIKDIKDSTDFNYKQSELFCEDMYEGFITEDEMNSVKRGMDIYFDAKEIEKRLEIRSKYFEKKQKESIEEIKLPDDKVVKPRNKPKK